MKLSRPTYQQTVELLTPYMEVGNRQHLCQYAFSGSVLLNQINYNGANAQFAAQVVNAALKFGTLDDGTYAVIALLDALRGQVGEDVQSEVDRVQQSIQDELKTSPTSKSRSDSNLNLWIGIVALLVVIAGSLFFMSNRQPSLPVVTTTVETSATTSSQDEAETVTPSPQQTVEISEAVQVGDFSVELFYSDDKALYLLVTEPSNLNGLEMESELDRIVLIDDFSVINMMGEQVQAGTCFSYVVFGETPVPPRRCAGDNAFEATLNAGDVFWYDFSGNRLLDMTVYRDDALVKVCPANFPCEISTIE